MKDTKSHDKLKPTPNITNLVTGGALDEAYVWVLEQRKNHSANNSIWHFILGCIKKGFDFLGVHFGETPNISKACVENHQARLGLRYAQHQSPALIGRYRARWTSRCTGLLKSCLDSSNNRSGDKTLVTSRCKELLKDDYYENLQDSNKTRQVQG